MLLFLMLLFLAGMGMCRARRRDVDDVVVVLGKLMLVDVVVNVFDVLG